MIKFAIIGALWRRWFGGGFGKLGDITRFWKYLVLVAIVLYMYFVKTEYVYSKNVYLSMVAFAIHWAIGHGDYFYLLDKEPDEPRIEWIDWVLRKIYGEENYYNFKGNCTGMFLRYTSTACIVAVCIPNVWFVLAGLLTVFAYIVTCRLPKPIVWAELLSGALNFGLLYLCL